jgi:hypothetical protein
VRKFSVIVQEKAMVFGEMKQTKRFAFVQYAEAVP